VVPHIVNTLYIRLAVVSLSDCYWIIIYFAYCIPHLHIYLRLHAREPTYIYIYILLAKAHNNNNILPRLVSRNLLGRKNDLIRWAGFRKGFRYRRYLLLRIPTMIILYVYTIIPIDLFTESPRRSVCISFFFSSHFVCCKYYT